MEEKQPDLFGSIIRELEQKEKDEKKQSAAIQQKKQIRQPVSEQESGQSLSAGNYIENRTLEGIHSENVSLYDSTYADCGFSSCSFTKADLSNTTFSGCTFRNCEFVMCKIDGTSFSGCSFISSRLTGMDFTEVSPYGFSPAFEGCLLDSCTFSGNTLSGTHFTETTLRNTDFTNCIMKNTSFGGTRFQSSVLLGCMLEGADFRTASGYAIDPSANKLHGAHFTLPEAASFLKFIGVSLD
jgi:fluoroquinolone resistance protein